MQHIEKVMGLDELRAVKLIRGAYTKGGTALLGPETGQGSGLLGRREATLKYITTVLMC